MLILTGCNKHMKVLKFGKWIDATGEVKQVMITRRYKTGYAYIEQKLCPECKAEALGRRK